MKSLTKQNILLIPLLIFTSCNSPDYTLSAINTAELAVDARCSMDGPKDPQVLPKWAPLPLALPDSCLKGIEINDQAFATPLTFNSLDPLGSQDRTLELDYATYLAPNNMKITGVNADGSTYLLFNSCVLQTWLLGNPSTTYPRVRPCEGSIRDFRLHLKGGTTALIFEPTSDSPYYIRVLGLCDFDLSSVPVTPTRPATLRLTTDRSTSPLEGTTLPNGKEACPESANIQ